MNIRSDFDASVQGDLATSLPRDARIRQTLLKGRRVHYQCTHCIAAYACFLLRQVVVLFRNLNNIPMPKERGGEGVESGQGSSMAPYGSFKRKTTWLSVLPC